MTKRPPDMEAERNHWRAYAQRLNAAARAVIAAGRPSWNDHVYGCACPLCAAWDALKALLEKGEA